MASKTENTTFTWRVDDGYAGPDAPHHTRVENRDIQDCETLEEAIQLVEDAINDAFRDSINVVYDLDEISEKVEKVWENRKEK